MFLGETIKSLLKNIRGDTEIIAVLDGYTDPVPEIPDDPRVTVLTNEESIGQRAATNQACKLSEAKYIMKIDAHCSVDEGFDVKMMDEMQDDWTMVPTMYNLHAFNWVCDKGHSRYQGQSGVCTKCGGETHKEIIWKEKRNPTSTSYRFDNTLHFQYWREYRKKQIGDIVETMSLQGSCFMLTREKYWSLNICDERHGSWGQQGTEVACATWLSGGRVVVNKKTWYAHMFRTQGGDFGFPYPNKSIGHARKHSNWLWKEGNYEHAIHPLSWLIEKFNPPDWNLSVGLLYYTDNELEGTNIEKVCQKQLKKGAGQNRIVSVSLKPISFGDNIVLPLERGQLTMFKQILAGLKALDTDIVYFCEADVLYHSSHFKFVPLKKDRFYYNDNGWRTKLEDGFSVKYDHKALSQMCCDRKLAIKEFETRVKDVEKNGFHNGGYEPGTRSINRGGFSDSKSDLFTSKYPNVDIRHDKNMTASKWKPEDFKSYRSCRNWQNGKCPRWAEKQLKQCQNQ